MRAPFRISLVTAGYAGAATVAGLVTVAVGLGWLSGGASRPETVAGGPALRAFASIPTPETFFGDVVHARVEVLVDRSRVRDAPVVHARFTPYSVVSRTTTRESLGQGFERRITTYTIRCLNAGCLPPVSSRRVLRFPDATVTASGRPTVRAAWPQLVVVSRTYGSAGLRASGLRTPSAVSGHGAGLTSPLLWASGGLAASGILLLGGWAFQRRRETGIEAVTAGAEQGVDPVVAACEHVRNRIVEHSWARQRAALDLLARMLAATGWPALAGETSALAWRREQPRDEEVTELLARVQARDGQAGTAAREEAA